MREHPIEKAIYVLGSQAALAHACGVSQPAVCKWLKGRVITPENAAAVERATNGLVTRRDLRPDDYWLIWPELSTGDAA